MFNSQIFQLSRNFFLSKFYVSILFFFFTFQTLSQSDYMAFYVTDLMKRTRTTENSNTDEIEEIVRRNTWICAQYYYSVESNWFFKGDISIIPVLAMGSFYKKDAAFNGGLFDFQINKSFNAKRPISMGPIDWRIGMGLSLGFRLFDNNGGSANSFLSYGLSIHNTFDIGENFQVTYFNNLATGYNPRYEHIFRTSHEFFIMYNANWAFQPTFTPYIETFRYNESGSSSYLDIKHKYAGFKIGVVRVID